MIGGTFYKAARVGERLSPYISICCIVMAVSISSTLLNSDADIDRSNFSLVTEAWDKIHGSRGVWVVYMILEARRFMHRSSVQNDTHALEQRALWKGD
jgi:phosphoserine aminotransferase